MSKVAEIITEQVVSLLDQGVVPWRRPWRASGADIAINAWGRPYRGINVFLLAASRMANAFTSNVWLTFRQVQAQGGDVKPGSKASIVVFWKVGQPITSVDPDTGRVKTSRPFMLRYFNVFNIDQTANVKLNGAQRKAQERIDTALAKGEVPVFDDAEAIVATYFGKDDAPSLTEGGDAAYFIPSQDTINVPAREAFVGPNEFYSTIFHEMTHSTGIASRLGRKGEGQVNHFGDEAYAAEELVAEFGAAFLAAEAGVDNSGTLENSAAYIGHWKARLTDDPNLLVKAAGQAQKAADFIIGASDAKDEAESA